MPRVRTRQPDTARIAFTDHIVRYQRASMQHSLSAKPCAETARVAEYYSIQPYTLAWRNLIASWSTPTIVRRPSLAVPAAPLQHYPYKGIGH